MPWAAGDPEISALIENSASRPRHSKAQSQSSFRYQGHNYTVDLFSTKGAPILPHIHILECDRLSVYALL